MSASVGIWRPFSIFGTLARVHPRRAASWSPVSPAAFRMRCKRSARPPGRLSHSLVGCKAVLQSGGGDFSRQGGVTDCQVPPCAIRGDGARIGDEFLVGDLVGVGIPHDDQPLIVEQPPVVIERQAYPLSRAARHVPDVLARLRMPQRGPDLPSLIVGGRLGQHADSGNGLALAGEACDLLQPRLPPADQRRRRWSAVKESLEVVPLVAESIGIAGLQAERRPAERTQQVVELVLADGLAHGYRSLVLSMTLAGTNTAISSSPTWGICARRSWLVFLPTTK